MQSISGLTACALALLSVNAWCADSTAFPVKPVRCIVPFAPGGGADGMGRLIQAGMSAALGQSFVLDNRPGGSGVIGSEIAVQSTPDGYTVLLITTTHTVNPSLIAKLPYDTVRDFAPVTLLASQPNIFVVNATMPVRTVAELIVLAKSKPGAMTFASGSTGSSPHLTGELFSTLAGVKMIHVPYKSTGPAIIDLMGGHVDMIFTGPLDVVAHIKAGRLRALGVTSARRTPVLPDVPTMAEAGVKGLESGTWYGVVVPARTPAAVVALLNSALIKVVQSPQTTARLLEFGVTPIAQGPDKFGPFIQTEIAKWARVTSDAKLTAN
ncbi:MAG: tripartite tricarboxylate transporter substrate binding protein [Burkholderiales bacterium]